MEQPSLNRKTCIDASNPFLPRTTAASAGASTLDTTHPTSCGPKTLMRSRSYKRSLKSGASPVAFSVSTHQHKMKTSPRIGKCVFKSSNVVTQGDITTHLCPHHLTVCCSTTSHTGHLTSRKLSLQNHCCQPKRTLTSTFSSSGRLRGPFQQVAIQAHKIWFVYFHVKIHIQFNMHSVPIFTLP